jgi:hypothetical protein
MRVEGLALALRPRSMGEACDLGAALVRGNVRSLWRCFAPLYLAVAALALCTLDLHAWAPMLIVFWLKPWLDRVLIFVLARAAFGEATAWADLWRARRQVLGGQLLRTLLWRRFSPWRAYTQAVEQLEGQRGGARRARVRLLLNGQRGPATALQTAFAQAELVLFYGLLALIWWFIPEAVGGDLWDWLAQGGTDESLGLSLLFSLTYMVVVLFLEPFYVAAGFAMYLNRRVALEAWDVEQEFRGAFA